MNFYPICAEVSVLFYKQGENFNINDGSPRATADVSVCPKAPFICSVPFGLPSVSPVAKEV